MGLFRNKRLQIPLAASLLCDQRQRNRRPCRPKSYPKLLCKVDWLKRTAENTLAPSTNESPSTLIVVEAGVPELAGLKGIPEDERA